MNVQSVSAVGFYGAKKPPVKNLKAALRAIEETNPPLEPWRPAAERAAIKASEMNGEGGIRVSNKRQKAAEYIDTVRENIANISEQLKQLQLKIDMINVAKQAKTEDPKSLAEIEKNLKDAMAQKAKLEKQLDVERSVFYGTTGQAYN